MTTNQRQVPAQKTGLKRRKIIIAAASSILVLTVALLFVFNVGNIRKSFAGTSKRTVTTIKDGNWSDASTWSGGNAPNNYSSDSIVILNNINYNVDYTVGDKSTTGIYIAKGATLSNNGHTLTLEKSASLVNAGTLNIKSLNFNGNGASDPTFSITNSGTFTDRSSLLSTNYNAVINNSGTMSISGDTKIDGKFTNSGTYTTAGNFDSDYGKIVNSGTISATGSSTFTGAYLNNSSYASQYSIGTTIALNYGSNNNSVSYIINSGKMTVGSSGTTGSVTINDGYITNGSIYHAKNGPSFTIYGALNINTGSHNDTNTITNNGLFAVTQSVTAYPVSTIVDNDSFTVGLNFASTTWLVVNKMAYLGVGNDLTNNTGTHAGITNNGGYIWVGDNFTNNWSAIYTGNGGGISIGSTFINHSSMTGTTDVCDRTPNHTGDVNGTMASQVTTCSYVPPIKGPSSLPVELTSFEAKAEGSSVQLDWATASEINNDRFEIERSDDGSSFSMIGTVKGNGTTMSKQTYSFSDVHPLSGIAYYRLHQVDFNGKFENSKIVVVHASETPQNILEVNVYPNPVKAGETLHVGLNVPVSEVLNLQLTTLNGANIYQNESQIDAGNHVKDITLPGGLKNGTYLLQATYRGEKTTRKVQVMQ